VNGKTERDPERWIERKRDRISFDGEPLQSASRIYVVLYKPKGYLTTYDDPAGRATVYDLLKEVGAWVFPVGRLDLDTSGLLLMTNDSEFAERIANPEHGFAKTYELKAATLLSDEQIGQLRQGVTLKDGPTRPAEVRRLRDGARHTYLEMIIHEGRNRQVRRMIEAVGSRVLKLVRTAIGPLRIGDLQIGKWRRLNAEELQALGVRSSTRGAEALMPGPRLRR
jgi:23S rRNA pseudouridine2605 synthase